MDFSVAPSFSKSVSHSFTKTSFTKTVARSKRVLASALLGALIAGINPLVCAAAESSAQSSAVKSGAAKLIRAQTAPININTADLDTLTELNGIGEAKAKAIIEYRKQHGPFKTVDQLADVKGIGAGLIAKNRGHIIVK